MSRPTTTSLALVAIAAVFCTAAFCFRLLVPVQAPVDPRLDTLRAEGMQLAGFSDAAAANAEAKFAELDRKLWTPSGFDHWRKATVAEGWTVQDLGPAGTASLRARRYAFQRPNATDREWPEITALLGNLEKHPASASSPSR